MAIETSFPITRRDHFAGPALTGLLMGNGIALAVDADPTLNDEEFGDFQGMMGKVGRMAWRLAGVMMLEAGLEP